MRNPSEVYANHAVRFFSSNNKVHLVDGNGTVGPKTAFGPSICINCGFTAMYAENMEDTQSLPKYLAAFPVSSTFVCTYSILDPSMRALASALFGRSAFRGKLPVSIPGFYAIGHGESL